MGRLMTRSLEHLDLLLGHLGRLVGGQALTAAVKVLLGGLKPGDVAPLLHAVATEANWLASSECEAAQPTEAGANTMYIERTSGPR